MDLKKPLTFDEQLDKLIAHGMIVADREKAKDILKRVNYYRFTGYALQFRQEPSGSDYIEKTTFSSFFAKSSSFLSSLLQMLSVI